MESAAAGRGQGAGKKVDPGPVPGPVCWCASVPVCRRAGVLVSKCAGDRSNRGGVPIYRRANAYIDFALIVLQLSYVFPMVFL